MVNYTSSLVTASSGPWNDDSLLKEFREAIRVEHNIHRADHGSAPLQLTDKLNAYAQEWANMNADMEDSIHRSEPDYNVGECLHATWWKSHTTVADMAEEICDDFYNESLLYDFESGGFDKDTAHFSQMVWYDTNEIGVGCAQGESGRVYCVVNYTPQGNCTGGFRMNVLPIDTEYEPRPELTDQSVFKPPAVTRLGGDAFIKLFRKLLTNQHNIYRKHHSVPFLRNADYLNDAAQKWAEHCAEHDTLMNSETGYGENLFLYHSNDKVYDYPIAFEVSKAFKEQEKSYQYNESEDHFAHHFTQMVWKNSTEIGVGIKKGPSGTVYVVCFYNPPGNVHGEYNKNVLRGKNQKVAPIKLAPV